MTVVNGSVSIDISVQINQSTICINLSVLLPVVQIQPNMFRASSCPSSGGTITAVAASGLPSELGGSSAVGRGRAGPTMTNSTATTTLQL
jgi:hypothetical protein